MMNLHVFTWRNLPLLTGLQPRVSRQLIPNRGPFPTQAMQAIIPLGISTHLTVLSPTHPPPDSAQTTVSLKKHFLTLLAEWTSAQCLLTRLKKKKYLISYILKTRLNFVLKIKWYLFSLFLRSNVIHLYVLSSSSDTELGSFPSNLNIYLEMCAAKNNF